MQNIAIVNQYIDHVPWQDNPAFAFGDDAEKYEEAFRNVIEYVPETDKRILFEDDIWDFRQFYKDINDPTYKFIFSTADEDYKDYLKFFTIYAIGRKSKVSTVQRRASDFITIISSIKKRTNHNVFSLITTDDIIDAIEDRDISNSRKHSLYACAHTVYSFIVKNYKLDLPVDIETLLDKSSHYKKRAKEEDDKTPNIPEEYYKIIVNKANEVLKDETQPFNTRMTAGLIIIAAQTGLRRQDLVGIKTDDLKEKRLPVTGVACNYLHFQTRKPSKAHSDMLEFDIYASPMCVDAFNKMKELREACEFSDEPYLYVLDSTKRSTDEYPISVDRLNYEYHKFFFNYLFDETQKEWSDISGVIFKLFRKESPKYQRYTLNIPKISQFRVHLATSLYNSGISLVYIQRYLGHLSEYMLGYYVRKKDHTVENAAYAQKIVQKIAGEKMTPLGNMGEALRDNLVKFVEDGHYNVKTDTKQILEDLGEKLVIREKGPGLCCIKTSIIPCKNDARTNEILCAYGMCPNIFHFFDMLDVAYMQFHALQESYQENLNNGFTRAAQKELNKLKDFIRRRLMPELKELGKVLEKNGIDAFCYDHPDLASFARNYDQIMEEVNLWEKY